MRLKIILCLLTLSFFSTLQAAPNLQLIPDEQRDRTFVVMCEDGRQLVAGLKITFLDAQPGVSYQITAMGIEDFDPVIAVVTEPGVGECNNNEPDSIGSQVAVPGIGFLEASAATAQLDATAPRSASETLEVLVGGYAETSGRFAVAIEDFDITTPDEVNRFLVQVPSASSREPLGVFMIGRTNDLNPYLTLVTDLQQYADPFDVEAVTPTQVCDDSANATCVTTPAMEGGGVIIENGQTFVADNLDAGIIRAPGSNDPILYNFSSAAGESIGDYSIVMTGTAPGDPTSTEFICDNVAFSIERVSSSYSATFGPENLLDNDPTTGWATTVDVEAPQTEEEETARPLEEFIVIRLDGRRLVDRVRVNGYSPTVRFEANSLQDFSVAVQNLNGDQVTVFNGRSPLQPGYRTYRFLPIEVEVVGFVFKSNYGGNFLEVADIQVCAAPAPEAPTEPTP